MLIDAPQPDDEPVLDELSQSQFQFSREASDDVVDKVQDECSTVSVPACSSMPALANSQDKIPPFSQVTLHVYDMGWLTSLTGAVGMPAFHVGVQVFRQEYAFGDAGVLAYRPGTFRATTSRWCTKSTSIFGLDRLTDVPYVHREAVPCGLTSKTQKELRAILKDLRKAWTGDSYGVLSRNCQSFAIAFVEKLGLPPDSVPAKYVRYSQRDASLSNGPGTAFTQIRMGCCQPDFDQSESLDDYPQVMSYSTPCVQKWQFEPPTLQYDKVSSTIFDDRQSEQSVHQKLSVQAKDLLEMHI